VLNLPFAPPHASDYVVRALALHGTRHRWWTWRTPEFVHFCTIGEGRGSNGSEAEEDSEETHVLSSGPGVVGRGVGVVVE
jgi:hypothetical protein